MPWPKCEDHPDWDMFACPICKAEHDIALIAARKFWPNVKPGKWPS